MRCRAQKAITWIGGTFYYRSASSFDVDNVCTVVHSIKMRLTVKVRRTELYETEDGKQPYNEWLWSLKDVRGKAKVAARVDRATRGNFGDYRDLHAGIFELKEDFGPGYRIYFGIEGDEIIILLVGGDKGSQNRDIMKAKEYWTDYLWRKHR